MHWWQRLRRAATPHGPEALSPHGLSVTIGAGCVVAAYALVLTGTSALFGLEVSIDGKQTADRIVFAVLALTLLGLTLAYLWATRWDALGDRVVLMASVGLVLAGALPFEPDARLVAACFIFGALAPRRSLAPVFVLPVIPLWAIHEQLVTTGCIPEEAPFGCPRDPDFAYTLGAGLLLLLLPAVLGAAFGRVWTGVRARLEPPTDSVEAPAPRPKPPSSPASAQDEGTPPEGGKQPF